MLHIINKSPYQNEALASCLRLTTADDALLFIEDGVYAATAPALLPTHLLLYALKNDVEARGLTDKLVEEIQLVDYSGFVTLTAKYSRIQTWL